MRAGRLDRLVTIQRKSNTYSDSGEPVDSWTTLALRRPASYKPVKGDERFAGDQIVGREQVTFGVRYSADIADINTKDRIIYPALQADSPAPDPETGRVFDIIAVNEVGSGEGLSIIAARRSDIAA